MVGKDSRLFLKGAIWTVRMPCAKHLVIVLEYYSGR